MNLIQYDNSNITLSEIHNQCRFKNNVVIINDDNDNGIAVLNKSLLEKIALSSFVAKGIEDVKDGNFIDDSAFFQNLESRLRNESV
ncbi:MAG: hypothetical protein FWG91_07285 [Lachnospiraceae bacterium]|nr:hypothetical protein [Lachnospiraceae bacterium]